MELRELFSTDKPVIGMLHVPALPGAPAHALRFEQLREFVLRDADALAAGGADGLILENYGDAPFFPRRVPVHTVAHMTVLAACIQARFSLPLGINVLRNDAIAGVAIAAAVGARFVRVNVYTGARLTDQGVLEGEAHRVLRYRNLLACTVRVFADVAVKHSAPIAARPLEDEIDDTIQRGRADAIIISGSATGRQTSADDVKAAKAAAGATPVLAGSGATLENAAGLMALADGLIVGTALKHDGIISNPVDPARVREFMSRVRVFRGEYIRR